MKLRICTLNIQGLSEDKVPVLVEFLSHHFIDILLLQETHTDTNNEVIFDLLLQNQADPDKRWTSYWSSSRRSLKPGRAAAGVAILFRTKLLDNGLITVTSLSKQAGRIISLQFKWMGHYISLANIYSRNKYADQWKLF